MKMTTTPTNQPFLTTREQAPSFWQVDSLWSVLASGETTGGDLTVLDQVMPARSGPPPHVHPRLHEYFYLLDGEIAFQLGEEVMTGTTGAMVSVPAGTAHAFAVVSQTARVLNLYTPGGFTEQISWLGTPHHRVAPAHAGRAAIPRAGAVRRLPEHVGGPEHPDLAHPRPGAGPARRPARRPPRHVARPGAQTRVGGAGDRGQCGAGRCRRHHRYGRARA